jgi:hypothetical protein
MTAYASRFENLRLPVILTRKGKGHRNVMGVFSVGTSGYVEPDKFIPYLLPLANVVLTSKVLLGVTQKIAEDFKVSAVEVGVSFELPMERLSGQEYMDTISTYTAGYQCEVTRKKTKNYLWMTMPVVATELITLKTDMTVVLGFKEVPPFFEDVLFMIEKSTVPMDAAFTDSEKLALREKLLAAKSTYVIMSELLDFFSENTYITSVDVELKFNGCVLKTDIIHTGEWKRR